MRCPFCSDVDTRVVDSRLGNAGEHVRRRRKCKKCNGRFTTHESVELNLPKILKSDGRREVFSEEKLRNGILRAIEKRPVSMAKAEKIISQIRGKLRLESSLEIKSAKLGDWVMDRLRKLDQVAYVRFASVYRNFGDIRAFLEEIEQLENELPPGIKQKQLNFTVPDGEKN